MLNSKYMQPSSLAAYGVILSLLNQVIDINEFGAAGEAMTAAAQGGGSPVMIIGLGVLAALGAIFKDERKPDGTEKKK